MVKENKGLRKDIRREIAYKVIKRHPAWNLVEALKFIDATMDLVRNKEIDRVYENFDIVGLPYNLAIEIAGHC